MISPSEEEVKAKLFKKLFSNLPHSVACQIIDLAISSEVDKLYDEMTEDERAEVLEEND